jgi:F-type H+-transporting ATPase subunit b
MYISLPTMLAEILSFLVFFYILMRYAYPPVSRILEERRRRIAESLAAAEEQRKEAQRLRAELEAELKGARDEARRILEQATKQAAGESQAILARAKEEAAALIRAAREEVEAEKGAAIRAMHKQVAELSIAVAAKILRREVDETTHRELIDRFLQEVGDIQ